MVHDGLRYVFCPYPSCLKSIAFILVHSDANALNCNDPTRIQARYPDNYGWIATQGEDSLETVGDEPDKTRPASSVAECCALCFKNQACGKWAFHAEVPPRMCHMHAASGLVDHHPGCYNGVMNRTEI